MRIIEGRKVTVTFGFFNYLGTGYNHTITIASNTYSHVQLSTDGSGDIAIALANAINAASAWMSPGPFKR